MKLTAFSAEFKSSPARVQILHNQINLKNNLSICQLNLLRLKFVKITSLTANIMRKI